MESKSIPITDALQEFRETYLAARNLADRTRQEYMTDIQDLVTFLAARGVTETHQLGLGVLNAYLADLDKRGLSGYTRTTKDQQHQNVLSISCGQ